MNIYQRHQAIRINWLQEQIKAAPRISISNRQINGCLRTKVKVRGNDGKNHVFDVTSTKGAALLALARQTRDYKAELGKLRHEWVTTYREPIPYWGEIRMRLAERPMRLTAETWQEAEAYQNTNFPMDKALMYNNRPYRSKGEIMVAKILDELGLEYKYETALRVNGTVFYPDFLVYQRETGRCVIIEYCGMLDNRQYYEKQIYKKQQYYSAKLEDGVDVIYINEYSDHTVEKDLIVATILSALEQNVVIE